MYFRERLKNSLLHFSWLAVWAIVLKRWPTKILPLLLYYTSRLEIHSRLFGRKNCCSDVPGLHFPRYSLNIACVSRRLRSSIFNTERNSLPRLILTSVTLPLLPFLLLKNCRYVPNFPDYLKIPIFIYFSFLFLSFPSRYDGSMVVRYFTSLITGGSTPSASLKSLSLNRALGRWSNLKN